MRAAHTDSPAGRRPSTIPGDEDDTMSRYETTRRQPCRTCGTVTLHRVTIIKEDDERDRELVECTGCGS